MGVTFGWRQWLKITEHCCNPPHFSARSHDFIRATKLMRYRAIRRFKTKERMNNHA